MRSSFAIRLFALALVLGCAQSWAQPISQARAVFSQFLAVNRAGKLNTPAGKQLLTGEAASLSNYPRLDNFESQFDSQPTARGVVFHVLTRPPKGGIATDVYFHCVREKGSWKISAVRAFALTGIIFQAREELQAKPTLSVAQKAELLNMNLLLSTDSQLSSYFLKNRAGFESLRARQSLWRDEKTLQKLGLSGVESSTDATDFVIGGMTDNLLLFRFVPSDKLPAIQENDIIWAQRLAPHWFLVRTT